MSNWVSYGYFDYDEVSGAGTSPGSDRIASGPGPRLVEFAATFPDPFSGFELFLIPFRLSLKPILCSTSFARSREL